MTDSHVPASIRLVVNGCELVVDAAPGARLVDVLREVLDLKGTRFGCGATACGACHVMIDGRVQPSCDTPLWAAEGKAVVTVEGLEPPHAPAGLREAFIAEQAFQCAYCASGVMVSAAALLKRNPDPTDAEVREALDGNLCRCGAHNRIVRAVLRAAGSVVQ